MVVSKSKQVGLTYYVAETTYGVDLQQFWSNIMKNLWNYILNVIFGMLADLLSISHNIFHGYSCLLIYVDPQPLKKEVW